MPKPGFRVWQNVGVTRVPGFFKTRVSIPSQHRPCGALVPAEAGPNFAAWWAGVHVCEQLTQGCYAVCLGRGSNSRPSDRESRTLTIEPPRHTSHRATRGGLCGVQCGVNLSTA